MKDKFSQEENKKKYFKDGKDLIDLWSVINPNFAITFCIQNIQKICRRYTSNANKAKNPDDILKAIDYINRALAIKKEMYFEVIHYLLQNDEEKIDFNIIEKACIESLKLISMIEDNKSEQISYYTLIQIDNNNLNTIVYYTKHEELIQCLNQISSLEYKSYCCLLRGESIKVSYFKGRLLEDYFIEIANNWKEHELYSFLINTYEECIKL